MGQEESKLVDEVVEAVESTETKKEFNPLAFTSDVDKYNELEKKEDTEDTEETTETVESKEEEAETEEDGWSWDAKAKEEKEDTEEDYEWNEKEEKEKEVSSDESLTWSKVGEELGLEIKSRDEFVNALNEFGKKGQGNQQTQPENNQISELRSYLNFKDRDLVAEELKADGIEESEIEESLDKLEDS